MNLTEIVNVLKDIFKFENIEDLGAALHKCVITNDVEKYEFLCGEIHDMSEDWLQKVYQYYLADRKVLMQDYTPKSLAKFLGELVGDSNVVIDMCAGSGALTIQKWNLNHDIKFELYEFDENVIWFLAFNMVIRNIECNIYHSDILSGEIFSKYHIKKGERFGVFEEVKTDGIIFGV